MTMVPDMKRPLPGGLEYERFGLEWAAKPDDRVIRAFLLDRLRENPLTRFEEIRVRVERGPHARLAVSSGGGASRQ